MTKLTVVEVEASQAIRGVRVHVHADICPTLPKLVGRSPLNRIILEGEFVSQVDAWMALGEIVISDDPCILDCDGECICGAPPIKFYDCCKF